MAKNWIDIFSDTLKRGWLKGATRLSVPALPGVAGALAGVALARKSPCRCAWIILSGPAESDRVYADLCSIGKSAGIRPALFPQQMDEDSESAGMRARVIRMMRGIAEGDEGEDTVVVASLPAILQLAPDPDALRQASITLRAGGSYAFDEICERLTGAGYERVSEVVEPGQMALRGGVLDIWPSAAKTPWRAEFFDTELESLRMFDPATQRSIEEGESVWLPPCQEKTLSSLVHIADTLPDGIGLLWHDHDALRVSTPSAEEWDLLQEKIARRNPFCQIFSGDPPPPSVPSLDFPIAVVPGMASLGAEEARHPELLAQVRQKLLNSLAQEAGNGSLIFICADTAGTCELLSRELPENRNIQIRKMPLSGGFTLPGCVVAAQSDLYAVRKKGVRRPVLPPSQRSVGARIEQVSDLEPGDYIVHVDHGIGRFLGSTEIEIGGVRSEVFTLEYAGGAKLHVPVSHAHLLSRYVGVAGHKVRLHRLDGKRWTREKIAAESAVQDLAASLLETQARRQVVQGFAFDPNPLWMQAFEADFPYQETADQERAIADIKGDMASSKPMDRLICGDAGYGKTEVAMRAAFLAVMNGKQVAVLVPTTVLAEQHYESFCDRMSAFPVRIGVINRFHPPASREQAQLDAATGAIDILIGTHALLSDRISFKNLGLLIIDEEQRFGVAHKEKLKLARQVVDVLTLSATPIPRTLYMSMTGARDMSLLQTPPRERVAVETRVARDSDTVLRQAVMQEIQRGGQVYFLYNRVMTIPIMRRRLEALLPDVRIGVAHGQMSTGELSDVMASFSAGETDMLLCTTLVESGLDIPRANTMIVHRADRFGISDLYQLRGRVGRSSTKGFAWLLLPENGLVDADARERIAALRKHSGLGAGFNLALRDLEIRGSGNLLGAAQSGHIVAVGFGLYCQLLRRTIARLKGEKLPLLVDVHMDLDFLDFSPGLVNPESSACLPYGYIEDEGHRMLFHRKIAEANSAREITALARDLADRYGKPPVPVMRLLNLAKIRIKAAELKIGRIETRDLKVYCYRRRDRTPIQIDRHIPLLFGRNADEELKCVEKVLKKIKDQGL